MDDRERAVMGTFKDATATAAVRECIMKHLSDFNAYMEKCEKYEKQMTGVDAQQHQVCPQSVMMLTELFHHFFDYCDQATFEAALAEHTVAHLLRLMTAFPNNTYLHCHVMEIMRRQISRKVEALTRQVFEQTELLAMMAKGVAMVAMACGGDE